MLIMFLTCPWQMLSQLAMAEPRMYDGMFMRVKEIAAKNRHVIANFGRFPERNEVLGRQSTTQELAYLTQTS